MRKELRRDARNRSIRTRMLNLRETRACADQKSHLAFTLVGVSSFPENVPQAES